MKKIWIAWEDHRRTKELASHFDISLFILKSELPRIVKHPLFLVRTLLLLLRNEPDILFVQNPSIVLAIFCCIVKPFFKFRLVVDLHNAAVVPESGLQRKIYFLYKYVHRTSDVNIVTNSTLQNLVFSNGGVALILPDKLPTFTQDFSRPQIVNHIPEYLVAICTFGVDEPFNEIIEAGRLAGDDVTIIMTGNHKKCSDEIKKNLPDNVFLCGYLPEKSYINLLYYSKGVIDLTTRDNCLVCGAYESVALGKPLVLSDTRALKHYFTGGGVFCDNTTISIRDAIISILKNNDLYLEQVRELRQRIEEKWCEYEQIIISSLPIRVR